MTPGAPAPPAIILGGGPIAVPVARSLRSVGAHVCALGSSRDPVRHSRACSRFVDLGAGDGVQERWMGWLGERPLPGAVLLPCNDDALELIARRRAELTQLGYRVSESTDDALLTALDKHRTYMVAGELGVPAPRTALATGPREALAAAAAIGYPCVLKPRHSHYFQRSFGLHRKVFVVSGPAELEAQLKRLDALALEMLVTEVIPGPDDSHHSYYSYLDADGRPLLHLTKRKLRQWPPGFGLACYHVIHRDAEVMEAGLRFFQGIGVRGVACVEFKRDARDGQLKLIECNHRLTAGHEVVRRAGYDLALVVYHRAAGWPDPPLDGYRTGVRMWHPVEDVRTFMERRRHGDLTLRVWLRSLLHRQHFPLLDWRDPQPSLHAAARLLLTLLRRFLRR